jgi:YbgC/YbaW family acyl-CoA thioester hydrolase
MINNKNEILIEIPILLKKFKYITKGYVKFHEVDVFKVVHNLKYLEWAEIARVEYCHEIGISILPDVSKNVNPFSIFLTHIEVNYFNPATYLDNYIIYTRVSHIGKSSCTFEHIITKTDGTPLCINRAVEVYVGKDNRPIDIDADIRNKIITYETELCD